MPNNKMIKAKQEFEEPYPFISSIEILSLAFMDLLLLS